MKIDHIGYAVKNIEKAQKSMEALGYEFEPVIEDKDRNIYIAFGSLDGYRVELVAPMAEGAPVDMQLSKIGPTPYHICYISNDIENDVETLKSYKFKVSIPLAPAVAFGGRRVVFLYNLSVGLVEIVEDNQ